MTAKTYTKRENAKRAAIAAGVPSELVQITVHKNAEGVRFGWKQKVAPAPDAAAVVTTRASGSRSASARTARTATTATAKKQPVAAPAGPQREERNGVKRPRPGGACAAVWEYLDQHGNMQPKELKAVAAERGWNENNALIELYGWRKFNGIMRGAAAAK